MECTRVGSLCCEGKTKRTNFNDYVRYNDVVNQKESKGRFSVRRLNLLDREIKIKHFKVSHVIFDNPYPDDQYFQPNIQNLPQLYTAHAISTRRHSVTLEENKKPLQIGSRKPLA